MVHGAFQSGHKASGWEVNSYLKAAYGVFKDSPARRADFIATTGCSTFPLKFCQVRWCENVDVADRALELLPNIVKYVTQMKKKLPHTVTCENLKKMCDDKLAAVKISFFASVAGVCEPFLRMFQGSEPLCPYLYDDLENLMRQLMKRFIKKSVMEAADSVAKLMAVDVTSKDNWCLYKEVDVGVRAIKLLSTTSVSELERMDFRKQCTLFLSATVAKLIERSLLKYPLVRAMSSLVPRTVVKNRKLAERRMKQLVQILYEANHITATAESQFTTLTATVASTLKEDFERFDRKMERLDHFYYRVIGGNGEYNELFNVIRLVLTISHGNASVESGFSINSDL